LAIDFAGTDGAQSSGVTAHIDPFAENHSLNQTDPGDENYSAVSMPYLLSVWKLVRGS